MSGPSFNDIAIGDAIPSLIKEPTTRQLAMYAGASGDFYEIHYDKDFAAAQGLPGVILHGALKSAFLGQLITDWLGEDGKLLSLSVRYREMDIPGDSLVCAGVVTGKDKTAGTVQCDIWIENGEGTKTTTGNALVALPTD